MPWPRVFATGRALASAFLFVAVATLISGCRQRTPGELLVGKWESVGEVMRAKVEFKADGTVDGNLGAVRALGSYRLREGGLLEMDVANLAMKGASSDDGKSTFTLKFEVSRNELVTIDPQGTKVRFKRVR